MNQTGAVQRTQRARGFNRLFNDRALVDPQIGGLICQSHVYDWSIAQTIFDREQSIANVAAASDLWLFKGRRERDPYRERTHGKLRLN